MRWTEHAHPQWATDPSRYARAGCVHGVSWAGTCHQCRRTVRAAGQTALWAVVAGVLLILAAIWLAYGGWPL